MLILNKILDPREAGGHYYSLFICLFQYFVPIAIMGYCYAMVANTMWRSRNTLSGREHSTRFRSSNKNDQTKNQQNSFRYEDSARKQSMTRGGQKVRLFTINDNLYIDEKYQRIRIKL